MMKNFTKRLISMALILAISAPMNGNAVAVADGDNDVTVISASYNDEITSGIVKGSSDVNPYSDEVNTPQDITLNLNQKDDNTYVATGELKTNTGVYAYTVAGKLEAVLTQNGEGIIGFMTGELENGDHIGMNLHYIPESNKIFIYTAIGYVTNGSDCETYIFGDTFAEMNTLVEVYAEQQTTESAVSNANSSEPIPLAAADYNVTYRGIGIQQGQLINGDKVDLIATTLYTPLRMGSNEIAKGYVKVNGHTGNATTYVQGTKLIPGALSVWASSGTCEISSLSDNNMEMSNMDPGDDSWNVVIPIPYYTYGQWAFLPWTINIGVSTIKTTLSKNEGSTLYNNRAKWKHNYTGDINWGSDGAAATQKGYAGCCSMSYQYNRSYDYNTTITGSGSIDYNYLSQYGATQYTGNFSVSSSISAKITIDKRS